MVKAGWRLLRDATRVLLEAAPADLNPGTVAEAMLADTDIIEIHDLHLWQITPSQLALSAHVMVLEGADCHQVRDGLSDGLAARFGIHHSTLQVDHESEHDTPANGRPAIRAHCTEAHGMTHRRG